MCLYIKDNGEQCGREAAPFCHQHESSRMAELHRILSDASDDAVSDSVELADAYHCQSCETAVKPTVVSVSRSEVRFRTAEVEYGLACACTSITTGELQRRIPITEVPEQWV